MSDSQYNTEEISPLFILDVEELIELKQYDDALVLCTAGLIAYPEYGTAHVLLAKIHELLGNTEIAQKTAVDASERFKGSRALRHFLNPLPIISFSEPIQAFAEGIEPIQEEIVKDYTPYEQDNSEIELPDVTSSVNYMESEINRIAQEEAIDEEVEIDYNNEYGRYVTQFPANKLDLLPGMEFVTEGPAYLNRAEILKNTELPDINELVFDEIVLKVEDIITSFEEELPDVSEFDMLAERLQSIKIERLPEDIEDAPEYSGNLAEPLVATETMANIYVMQGAYKLAIAAFRSLAEKFPYKEDIYMQRIAELESEMNSVD